MSKYLAHVIFDSEDGSFGLTDSGVTDALIPSQPSAQKGLPFSEIDLQELDAMNSHDDNL